MKSIPFYSDLLTEGTTNEVLLYGLIEALSFSEGYCWANSETMAERLGVTRGTAKNLLSSIAKKGWVEVKTTGNKRLSIRPCLSIAKPKRKAKTVEKSVKNPVEKSQRASSYDDASVTPELRYRHSRMTQATEVETGVGDNIEYTYRKKDKRKSDSTQSGLAGKEASQPASKFRQNLRKMMESYQEQADEQAEPNREAFRKIRADLAGRGIIKVKRR